MAGELTIAARSRVPYPPPRFWAVGGIEGVTCRPVSMLAVQG
jgi:hypothetical protein